MQPGEIVFEGKTKKGLDVVMRYPKAEDLMVLLEYMNSLVREGAPLSTQKELTVEEEQKYLNGVIENIKNNKEVNIRAWRDDKLVGGSEIKLKYGAQQHVGELGISIAKDFRGQGLGELLMDTVIKEAIRVFPGMKIIKLEVFGSNDIAMNLYKKMGFIESGRVPGGIFYKGEYIDSVMMYKKIGS